MSKNAPQVCPKTGLETGAVCGLNGADLFLRACGEGHQGHLRRCSSISTTIPSASPPRFVPSTETWPRTTAIPTRMKTWSETCAKKLRIAVYSIFQGFTIAIGWETSVTESTLKSQDMSRTKAQPLPSHL